MNGDLFADSAPYQKHSDTSEEAASSVIDLRKELHNRVLRALRESPCTDHELTDITGIQPSTLRPRRVELVNMRLVKDSGHRRRTASGRLAVVWRLTHPEEWAETPTLEDRRAELDEAIRRAEANLERLRKHRAELREEA